VGTESSDLREQDRGATLRSVRFHQLNLELIHEKLAKSHTVIKQAKNAVSGSTALLKQIDGEEE
jgi:hypothetical protein